ncbi:MAG: endo-1,3-alpha-glucanase family glycosylhydrolase [Phycisphaerae bacterium]|jgi:hypothetical protein
MSFFLAFLILISLNTNLTASNDISKPIIVAHYMSWYQTPDISGSWGFWQVNRPAIPQEYWHRPDKILQNNCRDISSVYYPVIGPYDSADPDLCEYHILLAKLAGIDAFVADWYGPDPSAEHPYDNIGFAAMRQAAEKLNFKVMICWEDRSMFPPISTGVKSRKDAITRGKEIIKYLKKEWFSSPAYLKIDNRPVLTNFAWGSPGKDINQPWLNSAEWNEVLNSIKPGPVFIHDWHKHRTVNEFQGYESVMPWGCTYHGDCDSIPVFWEDAEKAIGSYDRFSFLSGVVLPGFDNRGCGGWGSDGAIGITPRRNGDKFRATWEDCLKHNVKFIQIATWNDLNEGGTVEPVRNVVLHPEFGVEGYGYRELETIAEYAGKLKSFEFDKDSIRIPSQIYSLRKMVKSLNPDMAGQIDKARDYLLSGSTKKAQDLITGIFKLLPEAVKKDLD